jgi:hypothetical protein
MRNVTDGVCREIRNTHLTCNNYFFFFENRAVYEIMWKNIVEPDRAQVTIWHMRIACWISKATNTHSEYVILIICPHEHASMLRYTYIACLVSEHGSVQWLQYFTAECIMTDLWTFVFHILEISDCCFRQSTQPSIGLPSSGSWPLLSTIYPNFHRQSCILRIVSYCRLCFRECRSFIPRYIPGTYLRDPSIQLRRVYSIWSSLVCHWDRLSLPFRKGNSTNPMFGQKKECVRFWYLIC